MVEKKYNNHIWKNETNDKIIQYTYWSSNYNNNLVEILTFNDYPVRRNRIRKRRKFRHRSTHPDFGSLDHVWYRRKTRRFVNRHERRALGYYWRKTLDPFTLYFKVFLQLSENNKKIINLKPEVIQMNM